jgi:hypothetical protein
LIRLALPLVLAGLVAPGAAAQRVVRDTAARRDTAAARDTTRAVRDTTPRDTTRRAPRDTARAPSDTGQQSAVPLPSDTLADTTKVPKDTIKAPLAHAPNPPLIGLGAQYHWDRDSIFASGAVNLLDLLTRIPGVTTFRSGWLASPQYAAYLGDPARVRVFFDGLEIDPLDPRSPGALDMSEVPLWSLEEVSVERGADELRVYLRSWRVDRTTTNTRIDVVTGDQGTNIYRGFYGKRYGNGLAFQLGGQQFGTATDKTIGGGDELALTGRLGWAKGAWSFDVYASRSSRTRDEEDVQLAGATGGVPAQERARTDAYVRAAYGDPDRDGAWVQLMAATEKFDEHTPFRTTELTFAPVDTADTVRTAPQYVAAVGLNRGRFRFNATDQLHVLPDRKLNSLSGRLAFEDSLFSVSLFADYRGHDTTSTEEATARFTPLSFLALSGAVMRRHGGGVDGGTRYAERAELGLRLKRVWLTGGVLRRNGQMVPGLSAYDSSFAPAFAGTATGIFGTVRGKFYQDLGVDVFAVRWDAPGYYRPQIQSREELYLDTKWLKRFPRGNFGFLGSVAHEYRQTVLFPATGSVEAFGGTPAFAIGSHALVTRLEVRILDAVIFWHSSYGINPPTFEYVPGFLQPRQRFIYGVRWQFWN